MKRKEKSIGYSNAYSAIKTKTRGNLTSKAILEKKTDLVKILSEELECKLVGITNLAEALKVLFKDTDIKYAYSDTTGYFNVVINGNIDGVKGRVDALEGQVASIPGSIETAKNEAKDILKQIKEEHSRNIKNKGNVKVENSGNNSGIMSGINSGEIHR